MVKEIIKGCQKQQRESQKALYKEFYAYGMSIALRYAGSRDHAALILNDAFMKVFSNIRQFDTNRPFKPWLRQIVLNTSINHFHKDKWTKKRAELLQQGAYLESEEKVTSGISYNEIIAMVQELSPAYRMVFNLHVIEGFKHEEIAKMLKISPGTSKSNLARAKENLRTLLEQNLI